jgi:signal peptide peptidase SppA
MRRRQLLLFIALNSTCQANVAPLATTLTRTASPSSASESSTDEGAGVGADSEDDISKSNRKGRKSSLSIPKFWGMRQEKNKSGSTGGGGGVNEDDKSSSGDTGTAVEELVPMNSASDDRDSGKGETDSPEEGIEHDDSSSTTIDDKSESEANEEKQQTDSPKGDDEKNEIDQQIPLSDPQPQSNQTRSGILYMNIAPPTGPLIIPQHQHARPMPYPYLPQQLPPPSRNSKPPSLLSSILSAFFPPRPPSHMPPPSPYSSPQMPPFAPRGNNPLVSLLLRLALISVGTLLMDLFGIGSHSDAFLPTPAQHYTFERVNDRYRRDGMALRLALESPPPGVTKHRWKRVFWRRRRDTVVSSMTTGEEVESMIQPPSLSNGALYNRTVIIVEMKPDSRVGNGMAEQLRDTVSFLIEQHRDHVDRRLHCNNHGNSSMLHLPSKLLPRYFSSSASSSSRINQRTVNGIRPALGNDLEVLLFLDSPGGTVQDYGLASSQLARLRNEPQITLSVCVDKVAASGGYMMACQATPGQLFAAPFAMVGSIGVLMETVNVNEVLRKYGVKPLVIKAGKNKAPLKTLGEVTSEELQMAQNDADLIHEAFQQWVMASRPNVVVSKDWIDKVCTGAVFLGKEARDLGLVDRVVTSDEYVAERIAAGDRVLRLIPYKGPQFGLKLSPLDILLSGMDAEGRAKIRERIQGLGMRVIQCIAPLCKVGVTVSVLNRLASLSNNPCTSYSWAA